jgi:hypothetical protein
MRAATAASSPDNPAASWAAINASSVADNARTIGSPSDVVLEVKVSSSVELREIVLECLFEGSQLLGSPRCDFVVSSVHRCRRGSVLARGPATAAGRRPWAGGAHRLG